MSCRMMQQRGLAAMPGPASSPIQLQLHSLRTCTTCQHCVSRPHTSAVHRQRLLAHSGLYGRPLAARQQEYNAGAPRRSTITAATSNDVPLADRLASSVVYLVPLMDGLRYGRFFFQQFPVTLSFIAPIFPLFKWYSSFPLASLLVFFGIYGGIINNMQFSRYVRFNAMQAILLSIVLMCALLLANVLLSLFPKGSLGSSIGLNLFISINNTVWLYIAICFAYAVGSCFLGQLARLPLVSSAADQRVP